LDPEDVMSHDHSRLTARYRWPPAAFVALGFASAVAMAHAQTAAPPARAETAPPASPAAAATASNPNPVEGVTVNATRPDAGPPIPADRRAEFDGEAARDAAFRDYRQSTPPLTADDKGVGDPNDQSKDFPGLQSYVPK
jgi:hypothetical protein